MSADLVLTAAHGLAAEDRVEVTIGPGRPSERRLAGTCVVALLADPIDMAVVRLAAPAAGRVKPVRFGRVGDAAAVLDAQTVGYPWSHLRADPGEPFRDTTHVWGEIATLSGGRSRTLELRVPEPPPASGPHQSTESTGLAPADNEERSPWAGMSGAAVWVGDNIVGVVGEHQGPDQLRIGRLDTLWENAESGPVRALLSLPERALDLDDVVPSTVAERTTAAYEAHVRQTAPDALLGRAQEFEALNRFCREEDPYRWLQAGPWAGKSALASWWALHPPDGVEVVSFFVSRRYGQSDPVAFLEAVTEQLAAVLGEPYDRSSTTRLLAEYRRLIALATNSGRRLVLVVDGLDEDTGTEQRRGSIASLLPDRPGPNLKVLITSRPRPGIPTDVDTAHPLRLVVPVSLGPSPYAAGLKQRAEHELADAFRVGDERVDFLGLLSASGGGLTKTDFGELTGQIPAAIQGTLDSSFGRILDTRPGLPYSPPGYVFAHEELRAQAAAQLHPDTRYLDQIDLWADRYQHRHWPDTTPGYLLRSYAQMLVQRMNQQDHADSLQRLTALALSRSRQRRMYDIDRTWRHTIDEMNDALNGQARADDPDLTACVRLAIRRNEYAHQAGQIPVGLIQLWAELREPDHAESLALALSDDSNRAQVLADLVAALAPTNPNDAERIASTITHEKHKSKALADLAAALAPTNPDHAEHIASTITDDKAKNQALTALIAALAPTNPNDAERIASTITDDKAKNQALTFVVAALAAADPDHAERIASTITDDKAKNQALTFVVAALAAADHDHAEHIANTITDDKAKNQALTALIAALAPTDPNRAERIAITITDGNDKSKAQTALAAAVAPTDPDRADWIAYTIRNRRARANALIEIVTALGSNDPDHKAASRALRAANSIANRATKVQALTKLVATLAHHDPELARKIADDIEPMVTVTARYNWLAVEELDALVAALTPADPKRAERIANSAANVIASQLGEGRFSRVAALVAALAPDRASQIATAIWDVAARAHALTYLAAALAPANPDHSRVLAEQAEQVAQSITDLVARAHAFTYLAAALAPTNPDHSRVLAEQAEQIAHAITNPTATTPALIALVAALAPTNPNDAERIASTITDDKAKNQALTFVVAALAAADPDHAERIANTITDDKAKNRALTALIAALAPTDPSRAERIAITITDRAAKDHALARLAAALVPTDPDHAEQSALAITDRAARAHALTELAAALASTDPDRTRALAKRARQAVHKITDPGTKTEALTALVAALAEVDPKHARTVADQAEQVADTLRNPMDRVTAFVALVAALAPAAPDRARTSGIRAKQRARLIADGITRAHALTALVVALSPADPVRAEQIAHTIPGPTARAQALTALVAAIAPADPDRAEQIAHTITDPTAKAQALTALVAAIAPTRPDHARTLADQAEVIATTLTDAQDQTQALTALVAALTPTDPDHAEQLATAIPRGEDRARVLAAVGLRLSEGGGIDRARGLAAQAVGLADEQVCVDLLKAVEVQALVAAAEERAR